MKKYLLAGAMLCFVGVSASYSSTFKRYPVKSGMIFYDIQTNSTLNGTDTNATGIGRLVFDNWGSQELKEEDITEVQKGDFNETKEIHSMNKFDNGTIYTVDFDDDTVYKTRDRAMDISIAKGDDLSNETLKMLKEMKAIKVGEDSVAGFKCDVWKLKDQTICLYKGIPLKITIDQPGFHSEKIALQILLDKPISKDAFKLPDFPVLVDDEYTSNDSATVRANDYIASIEDLRKKMKSIGIDENNDTLTPEQERAVIDTLGERYLKKQKEFLPKLLLTLQSAKECVSKASGAEDVKKCIEPVNKIAEKLGDRTENFDLSSFNNDKKIAIVHSLENEINYLKVTNECVKKYNKTSEVIMCTEGNLGGEEK